MVYMALEDDFRTPGDLVVPNPSMTWTFARSGGAGGQHVNKTSSKAMLTVVVNDVIGTPEKSNDSAVHWAKKFESCATVVAVNGATVSLVSVN